MSRLSVVINTYNEEDNLTRVLSSIKDLADEVVVVDMESTDSTVEVAKKLGARVFEHKKENYVELLRNFSVSKASNPWILILDTDEEVSNSLAKKIKQAIKNNEFDYFRIPRKNIIFGKWLRHSRWWPDYNIRLFKKGFVSWNEVIHAVPMTQGVGADFEIKEEFAIKHNHYESLEQYIERMNRYTSAQAGLKVKDGYKFSWKDTITKPTNEFLSRYFFGEGYKDGLHGLALSLLQSFSELAIYLKIWQSEKFKENNIDVSDIISVMRNEEKDLHYWQSDALYKGSGRLTDRIKRKLRI